MFSYLLLVLSWFGHIFLCYYFIRPIRNRFFRTIFTVLPCVILTWINCQSLPEYHAISIFRVVICWMTSIRLTDLTILSIDKCPTLESFLFKSLWTIFPVIPVKSKRNEWSIKSYLILIVVKFLVNDWVYRWTMKCNREINYGRIYLFYASLLTISYVPDIGSVVLRILTGNQYTLESFTNFPTLSLSLKEFWGQRYNRFVSTIVKESIFQPISKEFSSPTIGGLTTFIFTGLFHIHVAYAAFPYTTLSLFFTFMFFFVHGIVCSLESNLKTQLGTYTQWFLTQTFLLLTVPAIIGPFIQDGSTFMEKQSPPLVDAQWIPKLPLPNLCPP